MAFVDIPHWYCPFLYPTTGSGAPGFYQVNTIDGSDERHMFFEVGESGTITAVEFAISTHTTNGNLSVRLESINTSTGEASGTLLDTGSEGYVAITGTGWYQCVLDTPVAVSKADLICCRFADYSASGINTIVAGDVRNTGQFPYMLDYIASVKTARVYQPMLALLLSTGKYCRLPKVHPFSNAGYFNVDSNEYVGNTYTPALTIRAKGMWAQIDSDGDFSMQVRDSDLNVLWEDFHYRYVSASAGAGLQMYWFPTDYTLEAGVQYYLTIEGEHATEDSRLDYIDIPSADHWDCWPVGGNAHGGYGDEGSWTDEPLRYYCIGLLVDGIEAGSGGAANFAF